MRPRTIQIQFGSNPDNKGKTTTRYSKVSRPLVITKAVDSHRGKYVITHTSSGMAITSVPVLRNAFHALWLLLPLADWRQGYEALQYDTDLLAKCREVLKVIPAQVSTRSS